MQDLQSILDPIPVPKDVKAQAWDAFQSAQTLEDFQARLDKLPLSKDVKASLWDAKSAQVTASAKTAEPPSVSGFLQNVVNSGGQFIGNAANAVIHPLQTADALANVGLGFTEKALGSHAQTQGHEQNADALVKMYVDRYGGWDNLKKTMYTDPVGFLADVSTVAGGATAGARVVELLSNAANAGRVAGVAGTIARGAGAVAQVTDPIALAARPAVAIARTGRVGEFLNPAEMYQSALKPRPGSNTTAQVERMVQTGLNNRIPVSAGGAERLWDLVHNLQQQVRDVIASDPTRPIDRNAVTGRLGDTANRFRVQVNPTADLEAIRNVGDEFTQTQPAQIAAEDAQALKQGTYRQLKDRAFGELKSATVEAQKALARGLKEELATAFPELATLNAHESDLLGLSGELERAVRRINNHQLFGIGTPLAAAGVEAATGNAKLAAIAGIMRAVLDNPNLKSRLAIAMHWAAAHHPNVSVPRGITAGSRIQQYLDSLGDITPGANPGSQIATPVPVPAQ